MVARGAQEHDLLHRKETFLTADLAGLQGSGAGRLGRYASVSREVVWIGGGQVGAVLAALVGLTWLTAFLPPGEYGQLALMLSLANLVGLVIFGPLAAAASRFLEPSRERGEHGALLEAVRALVVRRAVWFAAATVTIAILCGVVGTLQLFAFVVLAGLFAFALSMTTLLEAILNAGRLRRDVAVHRALQQCLNYGLALAFVAAWMHSALVAMLGFVIGASVTAVSEHRILTRRVLPPPPSAGAAAPPSSAVDEWSGRVRTYARPYERWGGLQWLQSASDRWALLLVSGVHDAGLYAVVYQLGYTPLGLLANLLVQTIEPVAFARAGDASATERLVRAQRLRRLTMQLFAGATAAAIVGASLVHGLAFRLVVDQAYWSVSPLLPWLVLAAGLFGLGQLQAVKWLILVRPERMEKPRIILSALGVVLIVAGAVFGGVPGVALGQVLSSLLFLAGMVVLR